MRDAEMSWMCKFLKLTSFIALCFMLHVTFANFGYFQSVRTGERKACFVSSEKDNRVETTDGYILGKESCVTSRIKTHNGTAPYNFQSTDVGSTSNKSSGSGQISNRKNNEDRGTNTSSLCSKDLCLRNSTSINTKVVDKRNPQNISIQTILKLFQPLMTSQEKLELRKLLEIFTLAVKKINLTYFMYGGTLLGSYRHHGLIPWDDDVDFICNASQKSQLKRALLRHDPEYSLWPYQKHRWKFYSKYGTKINGVPWKYPFVDISFFRENATHIWDIDPYYKKQFRYEKLDVFPLLKRPFWGHRLFAPKDTQQILMKNYKLDLCNSPYYNHKTEKKIPESRVISVPCIRLSNYYPFVSKSFNTTSSFVSETLKLGSKVLWSM